MSAQVSRPAIKANPAAREKLDSKPMRAIVNTVSIAARASQQPCTAMRALVHNTAHNVGQGIETTVTGEYGKKVGKGKCHTIEDEHYKAYSVAFFHSEDSARGLGPRAGQVQKCHRRSITA